MSEAAQTAAISARFHAASSVASHSADGISAERSAEIMSKRERVADQARSHFVEHRQLWTNRQYADLLSRDGERMSLRPRGMVDDRKTHLMRAADSMVLHRHAKRLAKIERAADNMLGRNARDHLKDIGR